MEHRVDAAVIGAGIAGSGMAKALADRGWETLLIDSQTFPRHKVCGEFLSPESQHIFRALDVEKRVEALRPSLINRIRLIFEGGEEIEAKLPGTAWGLSRYALDTELHRAAVQAGVRLQTGTAVTAVQIGEEGGVIRLGRQGEAGEIRARAVIAAWGSKRRAGLPGDRTAYTSKRSHIGVKIHYRDLVMEDVVEMYFFRGGYLGLCPVEGGEVNAAALLDRGSFSAAGKSVLDFIDAAAERHPKLRERLLHAEPAAGTQAATAPVYLNRRPLAWDGLPLLGDAGTMLPPLCGDGMSMALRSAALCAPLADRFLQGELSLAGWQQQYSELVQAEFNGPLQWGNWLQRLFAVPSLAKLMSRGARAVPGLAQGLVQATRLKL